MKDRHNPKFSQLTIIISPSYRLAVLFGGLGLFAMSCLIYLPANALLKAFVALLVISMTAYMIRLHALLNTALSVRRLTLNPKGEWTIKRNNGVIESVTFDGSTFVAAYGAVINLKAAKQKRLTSLLLISSRVDSEAFRRLRILLRWKKTDTFVDT